MDINYELYKVFYYVASSLSFSDASKKLFISQSAVSQSIKTLERKLGQPLFIRSTKKVQLTPAGALLLKHVEPAMNLISRGESQLLESGSLGLGQLHIGASDTICRYFLLPYLQKFHRKFPDVPIKITNASSMGCHRNTSHKNSRCSSISAQNDMRQPRIRQLCLPLHHRKYGTGQYPQYNRIFDHQYPFSKIAAFDHARNDPDHQKKRKRSGRNRNAAGCRKARHKNVSKKHRVHAPFFPRSL